MSFLGLVPALSTDRKRASSPPYVWYVVALLSVANVCNYADRMALAVLLPEVKRDLTLSDAQLGLLTGLAFFVFYAVCGIPIARWADRGVRRDIIALAILVWSAMTALVGATQGFWQLFLARVGVGAGEAGGIPPAQSVISDYVPFERRSTMFALHSFGLYVGMMVGMALAGELGAIVGWRWTFVALGLPGVALAGLVRFTLREPQRGALESLDSTPSPSFFETLRSLSLCPTYRNLVFFLVLNGFVQYALTQWWPSFYVRIHGTDLAYAGIHLGIAIGAGSGLGLLLGGTVVTRVARDTSVALRVGALTFGLSIPAALGSLLASSMDVSIALVFLTLALWNVPGGPIVASIYSVVQPTMRATAGAASTLFSSVLGFGAGPYCVGLLSDFFVRFSGVESLRYALIVPLSLIPLSAFALWVTARTLPLDLQALRRRQSTEIPG